MYDRDGVIRHACACVHNNSSEVRRALDAFVREQTTETTDALRVALVSQSAGHEAGAHDGSTLDSRVAAATAALTAWDGPAPKYEITIGAVVQCSLLRHHSPQRTDPTYGRPRGSFGVVGVYGRSRV